MYLLEENLKNNDNIVNLINDNLNIVLYELFDGVLNKIRYILYRYIISYLPVSVV